MHRRTQVSTEIEQQIGERTTFGAGYQYLRGRDLLMSVNQNVPTCVASGNNNGCRPNVGYANNSQYSSVGESNYHGLHVSLSQRTTRVGTVPRVVHALEVDEQHRRGVLQLADRSDRSDRRTGDAPTTISAIAWSSMARRRRMASRSAAWCRPTPRRRSTSPRA